MPSCDRLILLCRAGFEKECAAEIMEFATVHVFPAYIQTRPESGIVLLIGTTGKEATELLFQINFRELIFTRQWFAALPLLDNLPEKNRIEPLLQTIKQLDNKFSDIELAYPDTNEGKSLSRFCKQFQPHLLTALKKQKLLVNNSNARLHILFLDSRTAYIGTSPQENHANEAMGITRLRKPGSAPSRSTLKLEEAIHWFLTEEEQKCMFVAGMKAVDLGASPGGWSWQLVQRGLLVIAIDNGPMENRLMQTNMVEHYRTDAFKFMPDHAVDWLVCDMVERPLHVSKLITSWFTQRKCKHAIFNLKLPMKQRLQTVQQCKQLIQQKLEAAKINHALQLKQLYHDREEITVYVTVI